MSVAERREKRIGSAGLLGAPGGKHARPRHRDDAEAALRPPRRARPRLCRRLPDRRAALSAHPGRRHPPRRDPRLQHRLGRLFQRPRRPADAGGDHPDAHPGRGDRRARIRHQAIGLEGRHVRQQHGPQGAGGRGQRPRHRALCGVVRRARPRQRVRLRPGLGEMRRTRHRADLPQRRRATRACGCRRPISPTTTSAISPPPAMRPPRRSSSAASPGASRNCALRSSKAASAGPRSCSAI